MKVNCPTCKQLAEYSEKNPFRPFCSERCKLIDLGEWASEKFAVPVDHSENDNIESAPEDSSSEE